MQVTVIGELGGRYEVMDVDFGSRDVGFYTDEDYIRLSYDEVELVKD